MLFLHKGDESVSANRNAFVMYVCIHIGTTANSRSSVGKMTRHDKQNATRGCAGDINFSKRMRVGKL